jgi:hypothetical protein
MSSEWEGKEEVMMQIFNIKSSLFRVFPQMSLSRHAGLDPASRRRPDEPRIRSGASVGNYLKTGSRFSPGTLDSGFRRNDEKRIKGTP